MNIYIAGGEKRIEMFEAVRPPRILLSYYYVSDEIMAYAKMAKEYLLDSGAFTYLNTGKSVDFDSYTDSYIEFINANKVKQFIELDIDAIVGLDKVESLRRRIERRTGRQCIPVFHRSRGKDYFVNMCKEYEYIALGGIAIKDIKRAEYKYFRWFIDTAHSYGTRIHGLGLTDFKALKQFDFDSVDSTSWIGSRYGNLYRYDNGNLRILRSPKNSRMTLHWKTCDEMNLREWVKYVKYAERFM